jgi:hypothetical protein
MYRECDRGTAFFRRQVKPLLEGRVLGEVSVELIKEVGLKSIVYRLINKVETFANYGGLPGTKDFSKFLAFLRGLKDDGAVIFTGAHQNMGFDRLMDTFKHLRKNIDPMARSIAKAARGRGVKEIQAILQSLPNVGGFFAWQILCDLLEGRLLGRCTDNQWTCLGPGARNGLGRIFGRWGPSCPQLATP